MTGIRGKITLTPEARATYARSLGGVPIEVIGTLTGFEGDSIGIKADEVRFADLGQVPFAQGQLRFHRREVASISRETLDRRKSLLMTVLSVVALTAIGTTLSTGSGFLGVGRGGEPTPR